MIIKANYNIPMSKKLFYTKKICRLCKSHSLEEVLNLGKTPVGDDYQKIFNKKNPTFDLILNKCKECGFTQLSNVIDADFVYGEYLYVTKTSSGLPDHFKKLVDLLINKKIIFKNCKVLEVGSNDGTLLKYLNQKKCNVLGVDPAKEVVKHIDKKLKTINNNFSYKLSKKISSQYGKFDLVIANNVIANIDNLDDIFKSIRNLLKENSYFVMETFSLFGIIKNNLIDNIYHEHISYFTILALEKFANKYDLKLFSANHLQVKGGSIRFIFKKTKNKIHKKNITLKSIDKENKLNLFSKKIFQNIENKNLLLKNKLSHFIKKEKLLNKSFSGYGASVGSTTLMCYYSFQNEIDYLYDDESKRHNLYSPEAGIKVLSPKLIYKNMPDYIIILAWRYSDIIIKKNQKYLKNGGKFIIPLPKFKVIKSV